MRWLALLTLVVTLSAEAQWVPPPTARPTATRRPTVAPTATVRPTAVPTGVPATATPRPPSACPPPAMREFVFVPGIPLNAPVPGESLRFADGGEFLVLVRFAAAGEIPFRLVRIR